MRLSSFPSFRSAAWLLLPAMIPSLATAQLPNDCIGTSYVGAEPGKPFTAQFISSSKSRTPTGESKPDVSLVDNFVARDHDGRIRDERNSTKLDSLPDRIVALTWPDGTTRSVLQSTLNQVIVISDCSAGTLIRISPAMRYATIQRRLASSSSNPPGIPFSAHFLPNANTKSSPNLRIEDLGFRDMQGVPAHGVRHTTLGTETDGEWNGKPVRESEQWVSDELAAMMLATEKDFRTGLETRRELANIRRGDPDPALFTIPSDYKINPKIPDDLPLVFIDRSSSALTRHFYSELLLKKYFQRRLFKPRDNCLASARFTGNIENEELSSA